VWHSTDPNSATAAHSDSYPSRLVRPRATGAPALGSSGRGSPHRRCRSAGGTFAFSLSLQAQRPKLRMPRRRRRHNCSRSHAKAPVPVLAGAWALASVPVTVGSRRRCQRVAVDFVAVSVQVGQGSFHSWSSTPRTHFCFRSRIACEFGAATWFNGRGTALVKILPPVKDLTHDMCRAARRLP
jgi:hypothetical protein